MMIHNVNTDAELVRLGAAALGTQKKLARVAGCSERLLSEVANNKRALPTAPIPGIGRTPAQLIQAAIDAGGKVPEVHRPAGRTARLDAKRVPLELPAKVAARLRSEGVDLSSAILAFVAAEEAAQAAPEERAAKLAPWPKKQPLVLVYRALTPEATAAMAAHLKGDVSARDAFLHAVVRHTLGLAPARAAA